MRKTIAALAIAVGAALASTSPAWADITVNADHAADHAAQNVLRGANVDVASRASLLNELGGILNIAN